MTMGPFRRSFAALLGLVLASGPALVFCPGHASGAAVTIFSEDFDGAWPPGFYALTPVPGSWKVADNNGASGLDYWGRTSYRSSSGANSAWCAQNGVNSVNGQPNSVNRYYDQDMQAVMEVYLGNISGYSYAVVTFSYWARTGTTTPNDYLELRAYAGSEWVRLWVQPDVGDMTWQTVSAELPVTTTWVGWFFFSDAEVGLGPYEGVYVDDILIVGNDVVRPTSRAGPLDEYCASSTVYVPCTASDSFGSGVERVELYFRAAGETSFSKYAPPDNPSGAYGCGIIPFNTSLFGGDGGYEFYTIAVDVAGNVELPPGAPDAHTFVDTAPPVTEAVFLEKPGLYGWHSSSVGIMLWASDAGSGVSATFYKIGSGEWQSYDATGIVIADDGVHEVLFYSDDRAGNREQVRTVEIRMDRGAPELSVTGPTDGSELEHGDVVVSWTCSDDVSGIAYVTVTVDGAWSEYCNASTHEMTLTGLSGGEHDLAVVAFDRAGNSYEVEVTFNVKDEDASWRDIGGLGAGILAAAIALIALMLIAILAALRRRAASRGDSGLAGRGAGGPPAMRRDLPSAPTEPPRETKREETPRADASSAMRRELPSAPSEKEPPKVEGAPPGRPSEGHRYDKSAAARTQVERAPSRKEQTKTEGGPARRPKEKRRQDESSAARAEGESAPSKKEPPKVEGAPPERPSEKRRRSGATAARTQVPAAPKKKRQPKDDSKR